MSEPKATRVRCDGCWFFQGFSFHREGGDGQCRRHAPELLSGQMILNRGRWPEVAADDWCGDWKQDTSPDASDT